MTVTQIIELSHSRSRVTVDEEITFVLYRGEMDQYQLKEGARLSCEDYHSIMEEVLPARARQRCLKLLGSRDYTAAQLKDKLRQGYYPAPVAEAAVDYVRQLGYVDDGRFAYSYISSQGQGKGRRRIEQELMEKGVSRQLVETAWKRWEEEAGARDEEHLIRELLAKKGYDPETAGEKEKSRVCAFLMRRGFSPHQIFSILEM